MTEVSASQGVALVCMPWQPLAVPSIQLGILAAILRRAGVPCRTHSLHLELMAFLRTASASGGPLLSVGDYRLVGDFLFHEAPGEWVFANPPIRRHERRADRSYLQRLRAAGASNSLVRALEQLRRRMPDFVHACADEVLAADPKVVGFTTTLGQTIASLALCVEIKARRPDVVTVFGGAGCEGGMGAALHRSYLCIDVVVRGEGEPVLEPLVQAALADRPIPALPGVCRRDEAGDSVAVPADPAAARVEMDDVPLPIYDEYFARLERLQLDRHVLAVLPYESSRGCWWGQKSQCSFCGLNGESMDFRSKSADRVVDELAELTDRHAVLDVTVVDNILDQRYFHSVLPRLRDAGLDLDLFYQTKANLSFRQLRLLRDAGVRRIRPGIESLSTSHLRRMHKGVTALQNVRLLKWCAQLGIRVAWNLLYGLPGETPDEIAEMAELVPLLVHFDAPALSRLTLDRFSPYHANPRRHGIEVRGAPLHYRVLHDLDDATRSEIAWTFDYALPDGQRPEAHAAALLDRVADWRRAGTRERGTLTVHHGRSFSVLDDTRCTMTRQRFVLEGTEALVHRACESGETAARIATAVAGGDVGLVRTVLAQLIAHGLVMEEGGRYLSLAIPVHPARRSHAPSVGTDSEAAADLVN